MKFAVINLGCKVNQYESDSILTALKMKGLDAQEGLCRADFYIVNTCAVTAVSQKKSVQAIARIKAVNEKAQIMIVGCASQNAPQKFLDKENVTFVGGAFAKGSAAELAVKMAAGAVPDKEEKEKTFLSPHDYERLPFPVSPRTRSYIKIEDGCNQFCSYCLIPYLRGRVRSRSLEDVLLECESVKSPELVLTGINLSAYGSDIGCSLTDLIDLLAQSDKRIRLGSLEANVIDEPFLKSLSRLKHFCPHFHLSLQSGSDAVLASMNRHYTSEQFGRKIDLIRAYFPRAALTTDVIVGFPSESEEEFEKGLNFIEQIEFSDLHVFPYSPRKKTAAEKLAPLKKSVVKERESKLLRVKEKAKNRYRGLFVGKQLSVLGEKENDGICDGYSKNYLRVYCEALRPGEIKNLTAVRPYRDGLWAKESDT